MIEKGGYIKLYRKSFEDVLYFNEPFTKWQAWCDLIQLALWKDSEFTVRGVSVQGKRGCVYMSMRSLSTRWKWSVNKVQRFLEFLVQEERVSTLTNTQNSTQNSALTNTQNSTLKKNVIGCISILNYSKYQSDEYTEQYTNEYTEQYTPCNENEYTLNKEKKNNNILTTSTAHARTRTHEGEIEKAVSENSPFIGELKKNLTWQEAVCMNFHIKPPDIIEYIDKFSLDLKCRGTIHESLRDAMRHFNDWLRIQLKAKEDDRIKKQSNDKRRGVKETATKQKDYHSSF